MDGRELLRILKQRESSTLDFKITCNAFHSDRAANAELLKDLCAMANNGNRRSLVVIGVSDDGSDIRCVSNTKLTGDAVQDLVKRGLSPVPRVRLQEFTLNQRGERILLKVLVIGPNKRQAYYFNADFIDYKQGYCYRRHEVWIRRNATSDIASPAEVARLVSGEDAVRSDDGEVVVYSH